MTKLSETEKALLKDVANKLAENDVDVTISIITLAKGKGFGIKPEPEPVIPDLKVGDTVRLLTLNEMAKVEGVRLDSFRGYGLYHPRHGFYLFYKETYIPDDRLCIVKAIDRKKEVILLEEVGRGYIFSNVPFSFVEKVEK